ncbi:MAG: PKD domain-containing protein [Flavobacteriia bacterium]|nr:PKD domain-containing protein [Flavobacteriia bacterium]
MKTIFTVLFLLSFTNFIWAQKGEFLQSGQSKSMADTIVFDLANANYYANAGSNFIEIPVILKSTDPTINSFDFWFQFNLNELTYISTSSLVTGLDAFSNFNQANFYLSNTSSGTSINFNIPTNTPVVKLTFQLSSACALINSQDFNNVTTLFDGDLSSFKFTAPTPSPIQVLSPLPTCSHNYITFSYDSLYSGKLITEYSWDYGNMDFSSSQTDSTIFTQPGNFTVLLDVITADGCSYSTSFPIDITEGPLASFTHTQGSTQTEVIFTNTTTFSGGNITDFHWDFGDGQNSSEENPIVTFPGADTYPVTLTVTADNGCENTTVVNISTVGIEDTEQLHLTLFPNPVYHELFVESVHSIGNWVIYDASGREVLTGSEESSKCWIDISMLTNGSYTFELDLRAIVFIKI